MAAFHWLSTISSVILCEILPLRVLHRLNGTLPPEWSSLVNLKIVNLRGNKLTGTLPAQVGLWVDHHPSASRNDYV